MACYHVQGVLSTLQAYAGSKRHDRHELFCAPLMQYIARKFRGNCCRSRHRNEQLGRIYGNGAMETRRCNSHNGDRLSIQANRLSHRVSRRTELIAPETITDYNHRSITRLIEISAQHASTLCRDTEHRKVIGGNQLSKDPLWFCTQIAAQSNVKRNAEFE